MLSRALIPLLQLPIFSAAYSWNFKANPQQCANLTIEISGSDGKPPYRVLIIPFGSSPFSNNTEVRRIIDQPFSGSDTSVTFQLKYPANSQFVAVVSVIFLHMWQTFPRITDYVHAFCLLKALIEMHVILRVARVFRLAILCGVLPALTC